MQDNKLAILFEDEHIIAVNKPAKMLVHRSNIDRQETVFVMQTLRDQIHQKVFTLHRLDKPTSGVLLFAKSPQIAKSIQFQFSDHLILKEYIAVVRGYIDISQQIDYPLVEQLDVMTDNLQKENPPREAVTDLIPLAKIELNQPVSRYSTARFSLVRLQPKTGRKHQLRRHLAHIRHPIIGDTTHGDGKQNKFARSYCDCHRLLLHAHKLSFQHPVNNTKISVTAPFDQEFEKFTRLFKWHPR